MAIKVTLEELDVAEKIFRGSGSDQNPAAMYDYLAERGLRYAILENGVARGDSIAGNVALNFMKANASSKGKVLNEADVENIKIRMADAYLTVLQTLAREEGGTLSRDIGVDEAWDFHRAVFNEAGMDVGAWTLHAVLFEGSELRNTAYWDEVLTVAGDPIGELKLSLLTRAEMKLALFSSSAEKRELAVSWTDQIESPSSLFAMAFAIAGISYKAAETIWSEETPAEGAVPKNPVSIEITPDPQPRPKIRDETTATENITNGYIANEATHKFFMLGGELDSTDFASTQMGALATGNLRPGEIQLNTNVQPARHLEQFYLDKPTDGAADFSLRNATVLNGLAVQTTENIFIDPLLLDLAGTGVQMTPISDGVLFDTDNSGTLKRTGWADRTTGILVVDSGDGKITNMSQIISEYYGSATGTNGTAGELKFKDAFAALASEDGNADMLISVADPAWAKLRVWVDASHDGRSDVGELMTLDELGITQINLTADVAQSDVRHGNSVVAKGSFVINGETHEALAVNFLSDTVSNVVTAEGTGIKLVSTVAGVTTTAYASNSTSDQALDATALGVSNVYGGNGSDTLTAASSGSWLVGGPGANTYIGGSGDDVFVISASDDPTLIKGNGGRDTAIIVGEEAVALNLATADLTVAQGGRGSDLLISGGANGVFLKGGSGGSVLVGGGGNDVLVGGSGRNLIVGGSGKAVIYAGPQGDRISASAAGSIIYAGGGIDTIMGGAGDDVIEVGRGNALIDGGGGTNLVTLHGSYGDYQITPTETGYRISDNTPLRDGTVSLSNIQKLNFVDISAVDLNAPTAMPVADSIATDASGAALDRVQASVIAAAALLANDQPMRSVGPLKISAVSDAMGGTAALNEQGDVLFTPAPGNGGAMSFKYSVVDSAGNPSMSIIDLATGELAPMRATATIRTAGMPTDPMAARQWYLSDIGVLPVWQDYTGKGVRIGQFEPGGKYSTGAELFDYDHPDLAANVDPAWLTTQKNNGTLTALKSDHATMVAGVMVAGRNDQGGVGVAYGSTLGGHYLANSGADLSGLGNMSNYDVANHSWSFSNQFALSNLPSAQITTVSSLLTTLQAAAANGRGGLGTVLVAAGGNQREQGGSAQGSLINSNRYTVQVAAINAQADLSTLQVGAAPFSNPGASLLVSAPGSNVLSTSRQLQTERGSTFGSDYSAMQGTSFAAPIVSGVVALMLEANPNLGYRDVQQILALSARKIEDSTTEWLDNGAKAWNGGAMRKSDDYGYGKIDARAAVRLAEGWLGQRTAANEASLTAETSAASATAQAGEVLNSITTLAAGVAIEHVEVEFYGQVGRLGDLQAKLISPSGTQSVLLNRPGKAPAAEGDVGNPIAGEFKYSFMSTQHWGEHSQGDWSLEVTNAATGLPVTVDKWSLKAYGETASADDTYYFTDEYAALTSANAARATLDDAVNGTAGGRNTLNTAAISGDVSLNATTGVASLAGVALTLVSPASFQQLVSGDGNDTLVAGSVDSLLNGGRGQNTLVGGAGKDLFVVQRRSNGSDTVGNFEPGRGELINLVGFRGKQFSDLVITQAGEDSSVDLGDGQRLLIQGQGTQVFTAAHFRFQESFTGPGTFFADAGPVAPETLAPGTVILSGGAGGVSLVSDGNGQFVASLSGTVYGRDGSEANRFVVAKQEGVTDYKNALRGFRQGLDKIDLSQTGIVDFSMLEITKHERSVINGIAQIQGVQVSSTPAWGGERLELLYVDALEIAQLGATDFIFAQPMAAMVKMDIPEPVPVPLMLVADKVDAALPAAAMDERGARSQRTSVDPLIQAIAAFAPRPAGVSSLGSGDLQEYQPMLAAAVA